MASREEEKRRRREEREAQQRAEAAKKARGRRLQIVLASILGIAVLAGGVFAITQAGGDDDGGGTVSDTDVPNIKIPTGGPGDLAVAAREARCDVKNPAHEGSTHVTEKVVYKSNPPASGNHNPQAAEDGVYEPGSSPEPENWVHSLEHGRIVFQYRRGSPQRLRDQLEVLANEPLNGSNGYHTLVMENTTNMPYEVAVVAWDHVLGCRKMNDGFFAAARAFRRQYTDKAPEFVP